VAARTVAVFLVVGHRRFQLLDRFGGHGRGVERLAHELHSPLRFVLPDPEVADEVPTHLVEDPVTPEGVEELDFS
jgi:hypothetical protein